MIDRQAKTLYASSRLTGAVLQGEQQFCLLIFVDDGQLLGVICGQCRIWI
jgi:hypothetical protein